MGQVSQKVQNQYAPALNQSGVSGEVTLILGGQIQGQKHGLTLIYPQGNHIEASPSTPYLQIGETKYGKPVLDRVLKYNMPLEDGERLDLVSLSSTANSNITVGPPYELGMYHHDRFAMTNHCRFESDGEYLPGLEEAWRKGLKKVFNPLPRFDWECPPDVPAENAGVVQAGAFPEVSPPPVVEPVQKHAQGLGESPVNLQSY